MSADWTVLELAGVEEVAAKAARKVHQQYEQTTELDDLKQEALILLATQPEEVRSYVEYDNLGGLHHFLWCDLTNLIVTEAQHRSKHTSFEVYAEAWANHDDGGAE